MNCHEAREVILDSFVERVSADRERLLGVHLAACADCAAFAARQSSLDARLSLALPTAELSPGFRTALHARMAQSPPQSWSDFLPDVVHFASCGVAAVVAAALLPFDATVTLAAGAAVTVISYILLTELRGSLEAIDEPRR